MFLVLFLLTNFSQSQDWIKEYPGIPLQTGLVWDWITTPGGLIGNRGAVDSMKLAGIDIVRLSKASIGKVDTITKWLGSGFRVLPFSSVDQTGNVFNWIQHYTDAKYSVWEAEGSSLGEDDAGLKQKDPSKTEIYNFNNSTFVRRIDTVANSVDQLTEGPYYDQDVHYYAAQDDSLKTIPYNAKFYLMLQNNNPPIAYNPEDTICILQVTYSKQVTPDSLKITKVIDSVIVKRNSFEQLGIIDTVSIDYNLASTIPLESSYYSPGMQSSFKDDNSLPGPRDSRGYIQFKVIWTGKSNSQGKPGYLLSFDKVILTDERGRELIKDTLEILARKKIKDQDDVLSSYYDDIAGWIGIDEPVSIDIFEPIRIVKEILETKTNNKRPLRIPFMGFWDGVWESINNPFGTNHLSPHKEFFMRTNGLVNIWQNSYMYDQPFKDTSYIDPVKFGTTGYKDINIRITANNYSLARSIDSL
ncbi:MAG TPA: hypothetical protein PLS50_06385, partial [Candidatus Dojkabacteria bacterium]|nr:hypothetical protein [Candidatus Dojkabacteria bacterium]